MTTKRLESGGFIFIVIHKSPVVIPGRRRYYINQINILLPSLQVNKIFIKDPSDKRDLDKFSSFLNVWLQLFMGFNIFSHVVSS